MRDDRDPDHLHPDRALRHRVLRASRSQRLESAARPRRSPRARSRSAATRSTSRSIRRRRTRGSSSGRRGSPSSGSRWASPSTSCSPRRGPRGCAAFGSILAASGGRGAAVDRCGRAQSEAGSPATAPLGHARCQAPGVSASARRRSSVYGLDNGPPRSRRSRRCSRRRARGARAVLGAAARAGRRVGRAGSRARGCRARAAAGSPRRSAA